MSTFTILLGGDLIRTPRLDRHVEGSRVIAADAGIGHARLLGLVPELWVGDFDSVPADLPEELAAVPRRTFPAEKDKTDGELAIAAALERGATRLVLAGAFGEMFGSFTHFLAAFRKIARKFPSPMKSHFSITISPSRKYDLEIT